MRKILLLAAGGIGYFATPALARDDSWYVGVEGGAMIVQDLHFDIGALPRAATVDQNYGYSVDGNIGYDFGSFRVETEVGYQSATVDRYTSTTTTAILSSSGTSSTVPAGIYDATGSVSANTYMLNGLYNVGTFGGITGYVGGGLGLIDVGFHNISVKPGTDFLNQSGTGFGWQGILQLQTPVSDQLNLNFSYRYLGSSGISVLNFGGQQNDFSFGGSIISVGLTFNIGAPAGK